MISLSVEQNKFDQLAICAGRDHRRSEQCVIEALINIEQSNTHRALGLTLYSYAMERMGLTEAVAVAMTTVARKAMSLPPLREALASLQLSGSKASRIISAITNENASELIEFASTHTSLEIDFEVARRNPKARAKDKVKVIGEDAVQISITVSKATFEKLKRVKSLEAQKGKESSMSAAVEAMVDLYIKINDPREWAARKSARSEQRKSRASGSPEQNFKRSEQNSKSSKQESRVSEQESYVAEQELHVAEQESNVLKQRSDKEKRTQNFAGTNTGQPHKNGVCLNRVTIKKRIPLTALQKHAVILRD